MFILSLVLVFVKKRVGLVYLVKENGKYSVSSFHHLGFPAVKEKVSPKNKTVLIFPKVAESAFSSLLVI